VRDERDQLVRPLSEVLQAVAKSGNGTPLLADQVRQQARELAQALTRDPPDPAAPGTLEALGVLVGVHWLRYRGLPEGQDQDDLRACLAWSAVLLPLEPSLVPGPVRSYLADHDAPAIDTADEAGAGTPDGDPERARRLSNLGHALRIRFERTGLDADLEQAIAAGRQAVDLTPAGHPDRPVMLLNLGSALQWRFERTGRPADLAETVGCLREAAATTPEGHPDRTRTHAALGGALGAGYEKTGLEADLEEAVRYLRAAADASPVADPDRPRILANLGTLLWNRSRRSGQRPELEQAVGYLRDAVATTSPGDTERPSRLSSLGAALWTLFELTGQDAVLDQAIAVGRESLRKAPAGHPDRPAMLANLAIALNSRFKRTGQEPDLDEAITCFRTAADATPASHALRAAALSNLGAVLRTRFDHTGQRADLDEAVTCFRTAAAAAPASHPDRAGVLFNLGQALQARFSGTGQQPDLDGAVAAFQEGVSVASGPPAQRIMTAIAWAECELEAGRPGGAVPGYAAAIDLLPLAVWHGLDQQTRERRLQEWAGLASDAAAAAVAAGQPALAVELLEQGRTVLWTQALHLRQDLSALRDQAPELAATLEACAAVLNGSPGLQPTDDLSAVLEQRRHAARDWDAAVAQIRQLEDFGNFLRPVPFADLRGAAAGPVAIVNVSRHGSHALIITPEDQITPERGAPSPAVLVVDLPGAPRTTVIEQVNALIVALFNAEHPDAALAAEQDDRQTVFDVLAWTWRTITEPVLSALGYTGTPPGAVEEWPRVWWCPTGPAAILPLHAAGHHPRADPPHMEETAALADTVPGRVVSSYTQNLTSLIRAHARPAPGRVRQLAVGVPETLADTRSGYLPTVISELEAVGHQLPEPEYATHLVGSAATKDAVVTALPGYSWLHLSCHGIRHPDDPSLSAFLLRDQPLTLAEIAALSLPETDLAYLAACQTATSHVRLLDEAQHLAGALQLVGYRHVLASMWSILDMAAPTMADVFYSHLRATDPDLPGPAGPPQAARAPYALHRAVARLHRDYPTQPLFWVPYIHFGP
jgi:tetratricopeptide (TPR) repeat protein